MNLKMVTVTGADDSVKPSDLALLQGRFPFVEWGLLLSKKSMGRNRFPSSVWMKSLFNLCQIVHLPVSGHLCGEWVRDLYEGSGETFNFAHECPNLAGWFGRIQLNFHREEGKLNYRTIYNAAENGLLFEQVRYQPSCRQAGKGTFIFQMDGVNNNSLAEAREAGINAYPLFDLSGGAGVLPSEWPKAEGFSGYAGGLTPDNLTEQLKLIDKVAGDHPIWIDVESGVRTDEKFDLEKVRAFLEIASEWVQK